MLLFWSRFMLYYWLRQLISNSLLMIQSSVDCLVCIPCLVHWSRSLLHRSMLGPIHLALCYLHLFIDDHWLLFKALCTVLLRVEISGTLPTYIFDICICVFRHIALRSVLFFEFWRLEYIKRPVLQYWFVYFIWSWLIQVNVKKNWKVKSAFSRKSWTLVDKDCS